MPKVFVHGVPEVDAIWGPLHDILRSRGVDDLVTLSPPGFGAPVTQGWEASATGYRDWLIEQLESLRSGADDGIDLVGHDWGAGHTYAVAAERPDLLRSWASDCIGMLHPDYEWHEAAAAWQTPELGEAVIEMMVAMTSDERTATYVDFGLTPAIARAMADGFDAETGRCILGLYRSSVQPTMSLLADRVAAAPRRPSLLVDPTEDPYVSSALAGGVVARLDARLATLEGAGHWWMVEYPEMAADALISFWSSL